MRKKRSSIYVLPPKFYCVEPSVCPFCGSPSINFGEYENELQCLNCGREFKQSSVIDEKDLSKAEENGWRFDTIDTKTGQIHLENFSLTPHPFSEEFKKYKTTALQNKPQQTIMRVLSMESYWYDLMKVLENACK